MANAAIPNLPIATALDGTEQLEIVQPPGSGGTTKRATSGQIAGLAGIGTASSNFILANTTAQAGLPNSRFLSAQTGVLNITDNGAQSSIVVGVVTNGIGNTQLRQGAALSVIGVTGNSTANVADISGTANQVFRVNPAGTGLGFGQINLSSTSAVTGSINITAFLTGLVTVPLGGTGTSSLTANGVLIGNGTSTVQFAAANTSGFVLTDKGTASPAVFQAVVVSDQAGLSVLGVTSNATATPAAITGTADQVLRVSPNGTALIFGQVNLSSTSAITGTLSITSFLSGIVTVPLGGTGTSSLTAFGVIYGNGTSTVGITAAGSAGQLLIGQTTTSAPVFRSSTGDITYSAIGTATIATNAVTFNKFQTMTGLSVMGVAGTATAVASTIVGTANQVLVVNSAGTGLGFGNILLSSTSSVTGTLPIANGGTNATTAAQGIINLTGLALNTTGQAFTGGVVLSSLNLGTAAASTVTFVAGNPPLQRIIINGTATFVAPSSECEIDVLVTNAGSASSITFSGYSVGASTGDAYATTSGQKFILMSRTINGSSTYKWAALQ